MPESVFVLPFKSFAVKTVQGAPAALNLAVKAISAHQWVEVRPLLYEQFEVRVQADAAWLLTG